MATMRQLGGGSDPEVERDDDTFFVDVPGVGEDVPYPRSLYKAHKNADAQGILSNLAPKGSLHRKMYDIVKAAAAAGEIVDRAEPAPAARAPTVTVPRVRVASAAPSRTTISSGATSMTDDDDDPSGYTNASVGTTGPANSIELVIKPTTTIELKDVSFSDVNANGTLLKVEIGTEAIWLTTAGNGYPIKDLSGLNARENLFRKRVVNTEQGIKFTFRGDNSGTVAVLLRHSPFITSCSR